MVKKITGKEFGQVEAAKAAVIDFSATWCMPCQMLAPVLEEVSEDMKGSVEFYNVDVDAEPELAQKFRVSSIPAIAVLKDGKLAAMQVGFQPKEALMGFIKGQL